MMARQQLQKLRPVAVLFCAVLAKTSSAQRIGCSVDCSAHGVCSGSDNVCECAVGWGGQDCNYFLITSSSDDEDTLEENNSDASVAKDTPHAVKHIASSAPSRQPSLQNHLDAVRQATQMAAVAADRLRQSALQDLAHSAQSRFQHAVAEAHKHAEGIPGYQSLGVSVLPHAPAAQAKRMIAKTAVAPDVDDGDDAATVATPLFKVSAEVSEAVSSTSVRGGITLPVLSPMAPPCEANCGGHGACVRQGNGSACACSAGWVGMLCDMQRCEEDCNSQGMCLQGQCLCSRGWAGSNCAQQRCPDDCSGVGFCFTGRCRCKTGYDGVNCGKVKPTGLSISIKMQSVAPMRKDAGFMGVTLRATPPLACPDNCNGHGMCRADGKCTCNVGYSGASCDSSCANECSHNGDCIEGACLCFAGFLGMDCSMTGCCSGHGTCDDPGSCVCKAGWSGPDCSIKLLCPDAGCSGHGTCTDGQCHCALGFSGPSCAIETGGCAFACGAQGACNPISHRCECAKGTAGPTCSETVKSCPQNCNHHGLCMNGECMCGSGWTGEDCNERYFKPGQPFPPVDEVAGGALSGTVASDQLGSQGAPINTDLHEGGEAGADHSTRGALGGGAFASGSNSFLAAAAHRIVCGDGGLCSGHGQCNTKVGNCECEAMFSGELCERQKCPGFENGLECSGHGLCELGHCQCAAGWGTEPSAAMVTPLAEVCLQRICPSACGLHGECVNGACVCQQGWQGASCLDPQCPSDCGGHGQCLFQSEHSPGQCVCDGGWAGFACQRVAMYTQLRRCPSDCSGNGLCMDGSCACNVGFKGPGCNDAVCPPGMTGPKCDRQRCPNDCQGRGLCLNGKCACWASFAGADCKMPMACQESCQSSCDSSSQDEKCNACIGMCETSISTGSLGSHNPLEDLQSTF